MKTLARIIVFFPFAVIGFLVAGGLFVNYGWWAIVILVFCILWLLAVLYLGKGEEPHGYSD